MENNNQSVVEPQENVEHHDHEAVVSAVREDTLQAWSAVAGSFFVYFASFGVINSFGFFQNYYQESFLDQYSPSLIALIGTLQLSLMYLTSPVTGTLSDAYGPRYWYPIAAAGCCGSILGLSFTRPNNIWQQFVTQGVIFGLFVGFGIKPSLTIVAQYFNKNQALAMGIVAAGSSAGGVAFPIMFAQLIPRIGFEWSVRLAALILFSCYTIGFTLTQSKFAARPIKSPSQLIDLSGFRDIRFFSLAIGVVIASLGLYLPYYYVGAYATIIHPGASTAQYLLPLLNACSFFGRMISGLLADKLGRLNVTYPMTTLCGALCLAMWLTARNMHVLIAFTCLYGFFSSSLIAIVPAAVANISPADKIGARSGAFSLCTAVAVMAGTPIGGALIKGESVEGYQPMIIFSGCTLLAGGATIFTSRFLHESNLTRKW